MAIDNAKILNVRIKNKYDSYENWASSNIVLEKGEIAIAYTTVDVAVGEGTAKHPALLMKVGDGEKTFANLPWLSAKAADVLSVCKNENDLKTFVNNVIADAGIATDEALTALAGRVTTAEGAITTLNNLVGTTAVSQQISDAIAALNLANTYEAKGEAAKVDAKLTTEVERATKAEGDLQAAIDAINNTDTGILKQAKDFTETRFDQALIAFGSHVDTIIGYDVDAAFEEDGTTVKKLIDAVEAKADQNAEDIAEIAGAMNEASTEIQGAIDLLNENKADKTQVATDIADAVKVETDNRVLAVQGVQDEVDALEQEHAKDKKDLEDAIALKADKTALEELVNAAATKAELEAAVEALEGEDTRIEGLVTAEATKAREEEGKLAAAIKAITDDYLVEADKTELANAIATEKERAEAAEAGLQTQINTIMNNPDTEGVINSINEFTQYIEDHGEIADGFRADIDKNKEDIATNAKAIADNVAAQLLVDAEQDRRLALVEAQLGDGENSVSELIADAKAEAIEEAGKLADAAEANAKAHAEEKATAAQTAAEAKAAELATAAKDAAIAAATTDATTKADAAEAAAKSHAESEADAAEAAAKAHAETKATEAKEAAIAAAATDAQNKADAALAAAKEDATTKANAAQAAAEATAAADATAKADAALAAAKEDSSNKDAVVLAEAQKAIDATNAEVAKKANTADLKAIAFSGKTDDLVQGDMVLVFDCGTSAI